MMKREEIETKISALKEEIEGLNSRSLDAQFEIKLLEQVLEK